MTDSSPKELRLDPAPSRVYTWLRWESDAPEVQDDRGRTIQPAGSVLTVRFRTTGLEISYWPWSESEAVAVMRPGAQYDYSIGRAMSQLIPMKSKRTIKSGERQATKAQREQQEKQSGRRWLA